MNFMRNLACESIKNQIKNILESFRLTLQKLKTLQYENN